MTGPILVVLVLVLAAGFGVWLLMRSSRERADTEQRLEHPAATTLDYPVPTGQDPAVVMAALTRHGYTAVVDPSTEHQIVRVECPDDEPQRRERVREVISEATATAIDHGAPVNVRQIRFADE